MDSTLYIISRLWLGYAGCYASKNRLVISSKQSGEKLLALGYYGICLNPKDEPNDGKGIGRVVREIKADGTMGDIFFLYLNKDIKSSLQGKQRWKLYTASKDKLFKKACQEILNSPLVWMQMVEECDRNDTHLPLKNPYKAFSYYRLPDDSTIIGLWKHALTSISTDGGKTWKTPVQRAKGFVNSNAKIWGQKLSDGTYATVYNPSEFRWPLALSTSIDGIEYNTLNLVHGEISPMRYGGQYKSHGPQYVRGILPYQGVDKDTALIVTYSMNKEDIWVAHIPVPIRTVALKHANDVFSDNNESSNRNNVLDNWNSNNVLDNWNIMSLILAPVDIRDGKLRMADSDPHDYAKAERIIPATRVLNVSMDIIPEQNNHGELQIELLDSHGNACTRLIFQSDSMLTVKTGARYSTLLKKYEANKLYRIKLLCDLNSRMITIWVNDKKIGQKMLFAPIESITRLSFRTGNKRIYPTIDSAADTPAGHKVENAGHIDPEAVYYINNVITSEADTTKDGCLLHWDNFKHYPEYFNNMEDENIVQAIPNSKSVEWMTNNVPLFECPDKQIEEMYYYRWWAFRKSIRETPQGYVINEFLVNRSYADKYNMIACALGHHIMEGRWLLNTKYIDDNVRIWLRGDDGKPMFRLDTFSSWLPYAMYQRSLQLGNKDWMLQYNKDLQEDIARWEQSNTYSDGLFWQRDVKDGMEEQISGARKLNNRRPTINSYMYGNYMAMAWLLQNEDTSSDTSSDTTSTITSADIYQNKAKKLKTLIDEKLWNKKLQFYGTLTVADTLAAVREEIGYIPWYFNLPDDDTQKYLPAWLQLTDTKGFDASFGITTAERRHPLFRKRFKANHPSCEWDGAIWPFATSQTLTALANIENNYPNLSAAIDDSLFFYHFKKYTESQYRRGKPYIGEYLDETNGNWLMGDRERSRYYNHSTYIDLIITGLVGLRPSMSNDITLHPLIPQSWDYFCIDNLPYHGQLLTIFYDKYGTRYHQGKGIHVIIHNY